MNSNRSINSLLFGSAAALAAMAAIPDPYDFPDRLSFRRAVRTKAKVHTADAKKKAERKRQKQARAKTRRAK